MHIYPEDQVDENFFDIYYHPYKKQIWGVGVAFAIVVVSFLGYRQHRKSRLDEQWSRYESAVTIRGVTLPGQTTDESADEQITALREIVRDYPDDTVSPFALKSIVDAQVAAGRYADAEASLDELQSRFPDFPLFTLPADEEEGGSLADHLRASVKSEDEWQRETTYEHHLPDDHRVACVDTTMGTFWLGFYDKEAPQHVAAFVENAKAGRYNGTQVYEVRRGADGSPQVIRAGSASSKTERDPAKHSRDNPADTIEPEDSRFSISHLFGVVSAVEMPSGESRARFQVITAPDGMATRYDGKNTPFGAILDRGDSLATVNRIARAQTYDTNPETASADGAFRLHDHPYPPIYIRRVTILTDEKPEDGHAFDTTSYGKDEPAPWESDLPAAPLPDEFTPPVAPTPDSGDKTDGPKNGAGTGGEGTDETSDPEKPSPPDEPTPPKDDN